MCFQKNDNPYFWVGVDICGFYCTFSLYCLRPNIGRRGGGSDNILPSREIPFSKKSSWKMRNLNIFALMREHEWMFVEGCRGGGGGDRLSLHYPVSSSSPPLSISIAFSFGLSSTFPFFPSISSLAASHCHASINGYAPQGTVELRCSELVGQQPAGWCNSHYQCTHF